MSKVGQVVVRLAEVDLGRECAADRLDWHGKIGSESTNQRVGSDTRQKRAVKKNMKILASSTELPKCSRVRARFPSIQAGSPPGGISPPATSGVVLDRDPDLVVPVDEPEGGVVSSGVEHLRVELRRKNRPEMGVTVSRCESRYRWVRDWERV